MYVRRLTLAALFLATFVVVATGPVEARPILIDESHGQQWSLYSLAEFSMARAALTSGGHTLSNLPGSPGAITAAALAGYDVFFTGTLDLPYTADEITALQSFVANGGGVVVSHDGGWNSDAATASVNGFLAPYGVVMAATTTYGSGVTISSFVNHCLTANISTLGLDYVRENASVSAPAVDLDLGPVNAFAVYDGGVGWVIVLGDDTLWFNPGAGSIDYDITSFDNQVALMNIFGYVAGSPSGTDDTSWGGVKNMFR